jgi:CBS domain-containing protein
MRSIFRALEPRFAKKVTGFRLFDLNAWASAPLFWDGLFAERCQKAADIQIEEVVMPMRAVAVESKEPLFQALHAMHQAKLDCLPVVDQGKIVGLLEAGVVFDEIARLTTACAG